MKKIKCLVENIQQELCDAEKYIKLAMMNKDEDQKLAKLYCDLSHEQIKHSQLLHEQVVRTIKENEKQAPAHMMAIWQWEHEKIIDKKSRIRSLIDSY